jgi:hypothetical protein
MASLSITPYFEACHCGNALNYLASETRDQIYDLAFTSVNEETTNLQVKYGTPVMYNLAVKHMPLDRLRSRTVPHQEREMLDLNLGGFGRLS